MTESTRPRPPAPTRDAATVILVRDGSSGLEVFMLVRPEQIDFASGAMVFPGGAIDPPDRDPGLRARVCAAARDLDDGALALRVAAIREAYEECGVLLARPRGSGELVSAGRLRSIDRRYASERAAHALDMGAIAHAEDLELACDLLVPFAHWITPEPQPKRFDTRFYLCAAPPDHVAAHDGYEAVESTWMTPAEICRQADAGRWRVMFVTRTNLEKLGRSRTVAPALAAARAQPVVTVLPAVERTERGRRLRIPEEAGYGVAEVIVDQRGTLVRPD